MLAKKNKAMEMEREVAIPSGRVLLQGNLTLPADPIGIVLFAHGSGSSRFSPRNQFVAQKLHDAHLGTLLFDLLTEQEERRDAVTAQWRFDISLLAQRLVDATDWISEESATQALPIGYFGASTGAAAALMASVQRPERIGAIVSRGGRADMAEGALDSVRAPTLLIVGEEDTEVIPLNQYAYDRLAGEKQIYLVPGATHLFEEPGALETVAMLASRWFAYFLTPHQGKGALVLDHIA